MTTRLPLIVNKNKKKKLIERDKDSMRLQVDPYDNNKDEGSKDEKRKPVLTATCKLVAITGVRETARRLAWSPPRHTHLATETLVSSGRSAK